MQLQSDLICVLQKEIQKVFFQRSMFQYKENNTLCEAFLVKMFTNFRILLLYCVLFREQKKLLN